MLATDFSGPKRHHLTRYQFKLLVTITLTHFFHNLLTVICSAILAIKFFMIFRILFLVRSIVAPLTFEWFQPCMNNHMSVHMSSTAPSIVTKFAFEFFLFFKTLINGRYLDPIHYVTRRLIIDFWVNLCPRNSDMYSVFPWWQFLMWLVK